MKALVGMPAVLVAVVLAAGVVTPAGATPVLCKKKSGLVVVRDPACKKKEKTLDLAQFGAVGPPGMQGPPGVTSVHVRLSGTGTSAAGALALGKNGGSGGDATCVGAGCLAVGGAGGSGGGDGSQGGSAGFGGSGNASCPGATCTGSGGAGGSGGLPAPAQDGQPGQGGAVGERADCAPGERAVGGGPRAGGRASFYRSHPATTSSSNPPSAGDTPTAWYVEGYNSVPGSGVINIQAYAICASP